MFLRSFSRTDRVGKVTKPQKRSFRDGAIREHILEKHVRGSAGDAPPSPGSMMMGDVISVSVGKEQRLFAAHRRALEQSPFFAAMLNTRMGEQTKRIDLRDEESEVFACVLEYLYRGDYYPRLCTDRRRTSWWIEGTREEPASPDPQYHATPASEGRERGPVNPAIFLRSVNEMILRDTAVYCAADKYGLEELKRLSLRKQGLQSGVEIPVLLRSARYAYENTPDSDSRLRAHYLALIIRSRKTFKRSGTMQVEMEMGGKLWFDLFVALSNHIDDLTEGGSIKGTPRTV